MPIANVVEKPGMIHVPLIGMNPGDVFRFPLYMVPEEGRDPVLFVDAGNSMALDRMHRLENAGVESFLVPREHLHLYYLQLEENLEGILGDEKTPMEERCRLLYQISLNAAKSLLKKKPDKQRLQRSSKLVHTTVKYAMEQPHMATVIRGMIQRGSALSTHAVNTSIYAIGLGLNIYGDDLERVSRLSMAALLHDVGRIPENPGDPDGTPGTPLGDPGEGALDYDHALRGAQFLVEMGQPDDLVLAAAEHHERMDGSGAPEGLRGEEINPVARIVAILNIFDHVRSSHHGVLGVFETFKIILQSYQGCFDSAIVESFLQTFVNKKGTRSGQAR